MNIFAISGLINSVSVFILGGIVYLKNRTKEINIQYSLFCLFVAIWSFCYFLWQAAQDRNVALFWARGLMAAAIFIPLPFLHFVLLLLERYKKKKRIIEIGYFIFSFFFLSNFTSLFVNNVKPKMFFKFWPEPGPLFGIFLLIWFWYCLYPCCLLIKDYKNFSGIKREQIKYVLIGILMGYGGGSTNYFLWYDIAIPPYGNFIIPLSISMVAYAIIKFQLMDINLFITRAVIFSVVYTLVLAVPFYVMILAKGFIERLGYYGILIPLSMGMVFASAGPFIYLFVRRRTENILLKDQLRYQETLRKVSATLTLVKDLERLLKLVVLRIARAVKVDFACMYLASGNKLSQKYPYTIKGFFPELPKELFSDSDLIRYIATRSKPVLAEELDEKIKREFDFRNGLITPSFVRGRLLGLLVLGPKSTGIIYTQEDANIFGILANQLALAIENTEFIEESQKNQAQLFATERMTSMGAMAGGMSHQLNNRFHAISMATSDTIDTLKFIDTSSCSEEVKQYLTDVKHALTRIQENAKHGGKIVNDFLNLSQPDRIQKESKKFDLKEPLERAIEMVKIKTTFPDEILKKEIQEELPNIEGDFVLLQDSFFNLIDNAIDALTRKEFAIQNKQLPRSPMHKGNITVRIYKSDSSIVVEIQDNGIGMTEDVKAKVFAPFFTTKATAVKGAGMGLFVIQKIINAHQGEIKVSSEYGQGAIFTITLPITQKKG